VENVKSVLLQLLPPVLPENIDFVSPIHEVQ